MPVMAGILPDPLTPGFWNKAKAEIPAGTISVLRLMFEDVDIAVFLRWWILQSYLPCKYVIAFSKLWP